MDLSIYFELYYRIIWSSQAIKCLLDHDIMLCLSFLHKKHKLHLYFIIYTYFYVHMNVYICTFRVYAFQKLQKSIKCALIACS